MDIDSLSADELENLKKNRNKKIQKMKEMTVKNTTHNRLTYVGNTRPINETVNNNVLDTIWSMLTNNHITRSHGGVRVL